MSSCTRNDETTSTVGNIPLPENRFELELEFVQCLASPAYIHFLATSPVGDTEGGTILQDPAFVRFLVYLRKTWTRPEYSRFLSYPHCLFFLDLLIEKPTVLKEWTLPAFRNFCHQQQFLAWQHRHSTCYGSGMENQQASSPGVEQEHNTMAHDGAQTRSASAGM